MKYDWMDEYLMAKPGVEKDFKEEWNWRRYMIYGKMFAALCFDDNNKESLITLKLEPVEGDFLRQQYKDIIPGYYMNKVHWNSVISFFQQPVRQVFDLDAVVVSYSESISGQDDFFIVVPDICQWLQLSVEGFF